MMKNLTDKQIKFMLAMVAVVLLAVMLVVSLFFEIPKENATTVNGILSIVTTITGWAYMDYFKSKERDTDKERDDDKSNKS